MHKFKLFILIPLYAAFVLHPIQGHSQINEQCKNVTNTADILTCVKKQNDKATDRLSRVFEEINATHPPESLSEFRAAQKNWLIYRDQECLWETHQENNEALKRIKELSCLSKLTNQRAKALQSSITPNKEETPEEKFGTFPRWLNALSEKHPKLFWNYASLIEADLNADGRNEAIITGLDLPEKEAASQFHVAIINTPETGKPHITLFKFPITPPHPPQTPTQESENTQAPLTGQTTLCSPAITLKIEETIQTKEKKEEKKTENKKPEPQKTTPTSKHLSIIHKNCSPIIIEWNKDLTVFQQREEHKE